MFEECNCLIIYSWLCFSLRVTFRINRTPQMSANLYFTEREGLKKVLVNTQTELGVPSWKSKEFLVGVGFPPLLMIRFAILTDRICRHGQRWIEANADIFPVCWVWERAECKIEAVNLLVDLHYNPTLKCGYKFLVVIKRKRSKLHGSCIWRDSPLGTFLMRYSWRMAHSQTCWKDFSDWIWSVWAGGVGNAAPWKKTQKNLTEEQERQKFNSLKSKQGNGTQLGK